MTETVIPTVDLDVEWQGAMRFAGTVGDTSMILDGAAQAGPTPVHAMLFGLAGCMAIDVVNIVTKGRHPLASLRAHLHCERAPDNPKRATRVVVRFSVSGDVPEAAVARAIELSRQTYCSVWHSLRQDIVFETSFEIVKAT